MAFILVLWRAIYQLVCVFIPNSTNSIKSHPHLSLIIIIMFCCRLLNRSMLRYKYICRLEVEKKLSFQTMVKDQETADWFNVILSRFWLIYEPVLSETIMLSVNPILEYYTPSFIVRLHTVSSRESQIALSLRILLRCPNSHWALPHHTSEMQEDTRNTTTISSALNWMWISNPVILIRFRRRKASGTQRLCYQLESAGE